MADQISEKTDQIGIGLYFSNWKLVHVNKFFFMMPYENGQLIIFLTDTL